MTFEYVNGAMRCFYTGLVPDNASTEFMNGYNDAKSGKLLFDTIRKEYRKLLKCTGNWRDCHCGDCAGIRIESQLD